MDRLSGENKGIFFLNDALIKLDECYIRGVATSI